MKQRQRVLEMKYLYPDPGGRSAPRVSLALECGHTVFRTHGVGHEHIVNGDYFVLCDLCASKSATARFKDPHVLSVDLPAFGYVGEAQCQGCDAIVMVFRFNENDDGVDRLFPHSKGQRVVRGFARCPWTYARVFEGVA